MKRICSGIAMVVVATVVLAKTTSVSGSGPTEAQACDQARSRADTRMTVDCRGEGGVDRGGPGECKITDMSRGDKKEYLAEVKVTYFCAAPK